MIPAAPAGWHAHLQLQAQVQDGRCITFHRHRGPLRVLKALHPEGPAVCHHVIVHPPAGIVGGDRLELSLQLDPAAHLVLTTPGASRFYRSEGAQAVQQVQSRLAAGSRLEWLPLETLVYTGARAESLQRHDLHDDAEMIGWDLLALGLPGAGAPFNQGSYLQHLELPGLWLERGHIDANDRLLLDAASGLAGYRVIGTAWWAAGPAVASGRAELALQAARQALDEPGWPVGSTALDARLVVLRLLAPSTEAAMQGLRQLRSAWRRALWQLEPTEPRVWAT